VDGEHRRGAGPVSGQRPRLCAHTFVLCEPLAEVGFFKARRSDVQRSYGAARIRRALSLSEKEVYSMRGNLWDSDAFKTSGFGSAGIDPSSYLLEDQLSLTSSDALEEPRRKERGVPSNEMPGVTGAWGFVMEEEIIDLMDSWNEMVEAIEWYEWTDVMSEAETHKVLDELEYTYKDDRAKDPALLGCLVARLLAVQRCPPIQVSHGGGDGPRVLRERV
jgi:hypothetical protein